MVRSTEGYTITTDTENRCLRKFFDGPVEGEQPDWRVDVARSVAQGAAVLKEVVVFVCYDDVVFFE